MKKACVCREGITEKFDDDGKVIERIPTNLHVHDCQYILLRNLLILKAERFALQEVGQGKDGKPNAGYSRAFIRTMDELARSSGLVK